MIDLEKAPLLNTPSANWVEDHIFTEEIEKALSSHSPRIQARYAFLFGDYAKAVNILQNEDQDLDALFMLAYSHDKSGLQKPAEAKRYFQAIIERYPHSLWVREAQKQIKN
ncbi:MAG: tol-pal system YbgF family protein [Kiritimatiellia bacterium]